MARLDWFLRSVARLVIANTRLGIAITVLALIQQHYHDFGPTFALEKLVAEHDVSLSKETLRKWMVGAGFWKTRKERRSRVYQPRNRRDCFGELIQLDGSHHWWFEGRGQKCALLVYIDDATGQLVHLRFAQSENAFDYFEGTKAYLKQFGKPLAFYTDKHGVLLVKSRSFWWWPQCHLVKLNTAQNWCCGAAVRSCIRSCKCQLVAQDAKRSVSFADQSIKLETVESPHLGHSGLMEFTRRSSGSFHSRSLEWYLSADQNRRHSDQPSQYC